MPYFCAICSGRLVWCYWCKTKHCTHRPHQATRPGKSYIRKIVVIRTKVGDTRLMAARRYAHLKGAQKGGQTTASRPNPGCFTSETARKAARKVWATRWKLNKRIGVRLGRPAKNAPPVKRGPLRAYYEAHPTEGIEYVAYCCRWFLTDPVSGVRRTITERTALRRLGHLKTARKNWVPDPEKGEIIIATTVGKDPALPRNRRT